MPPQGSSTARRDKPPNGQQLLDACRQIVNRGHFTCHPHVKRAEQLKVEEKTTGQAKDARRWLIRLPGTGGKRGGSITLFGGRWDAASDEGNLQINTNPDGTRSLRSCLLTHCSQFSVPAACAIPESTQEATEARCHPMAAVTAASGPPLEHMLNQAVGQLDPGMAAALLTLQPSTSPTDEAAGHL